LETREDSLVLYELIKQDFLKDGNINSLKILPISRLKEPPKTTPLPEVYELEDDKDLSAIENSNNLSDSPQDLVNDLIFESPEKEDHDYCSKEETKLTPTQKNRVEFEEDEYIDSEDSGEKVNFPLRINDSQRKNLVESPQREFKNEQIGGESYFSFKTPGLHSVIIRIVKKEANNIKK